MDNWIEIPSELIARNEEIDLCIDIAFINNFVALTGRDKQLKARHLHELANRTKSQMYSAIDKMFRDYNYAGFRIKTIFCDQEFKPVFEEVKDELGVDMEYTATGEHEPTAERNIQHIKALFRTQFHRMPFKAIPKVLTKHIAIRVVATSNYYPQKGGISKYYSPHMILKKEKVDYMKECAVESGSYVQGYGHETHRNQRTRTVDAIYCRPDDRSRNGHILFDLHTGKEITRNKVKVLPMTAQVIKMVEDRARDEGVTELRTYSRRNGEVILDGDLLAGVDPDTLWDEEYNPDEEDTPPEKDDNLEWETIDEEEVDDIINDAADDLIFRDDEIEDEIVNRIIEKARERQRRMDKLDEEYEQPRQPEDDLPLTEDQEDEVMKEMIQELNALEHDSDKEEEIYFEDDSKFEDEDSDDDSVPGLVRRAYVNDDEDSDDNSDDESPPAPVDKHEGRKHRSGKAYWQGKTKMRPNLRPGTIKTKHQAYIKRKKSKSNSLKNRSAMRRNARMKHLRTALHQHVS